MPRMHIWVMDHRDEDWQQSGPVIAPWLIDDRTSPGKQYADYCALFNVWQTSEPPEIVGFFGYRKYLWHPKWYTFLPNEISWAHAPDWSKSSRAAFDAYRQWWTTSDGQPIQELLAQHDILQAAPFPLTCSILNDFAVSRSRNDATAIGQAMLRAGVSVRRHLVYPYLFITRWSVFDRMMREIEPIRQELEPLITAEDSTNEEYTKRPMAYIMERVYSLWLENSGLSIKEMPLLHCWEKS